MTYFLLLTIFSHISDGSLSGRVTYAWFPSLRADFVTQCNAPKFRRHAAGYCGLAAESSCVTDFFWDVYVEQKTLALRCVAEFLRKD